MSRDLRYARSAYVMRHLAIVERLADRLQSAPLEVRRLGLPLALAGWDREAKPELVRLVAGWIYGEEGWGMLPRRAVPQSAVALLDALEKDDVADGAARSAVEMEAEALLQAAKLLGGAAAERRGAADGG